MECSGRGSLLLEKCVWERQEVQELGVGQTWMEATEDDQKERILNVLNRVLTLAIVS